MSAKDYLEKDYYKTLGVAADAKADAIKKSYRKLAKKFHPDANKGDAEAERRFKEISEAYDVLADDKRRAEYDEMRRLGASGFRFPGGAGARGPGGPGNVQFDFSSLFDQGGGMGGAAGMEDVLGGLFGGARRGGAMQPRRGADVESSVTLSFREALDGVTVPLRLTAQGACPTCHGSGARPGTVPHTCPVCQGSGQTARNLGGFAFAEPCQNCKGRGVVVDDPCPTCQGSGEAPSTRTIQARIPAGVKDGQRIRLKGKGAPGARGGPPGDLFVEVHVQPHPVFGRRTGHDVTLTVPITFPEAVLGGEIVVPAPDATTVTLRIPPGTKSGRTLRVRGKGGLKRDGSRGDLLVTVEVAVPQRVDAEASQALRAYADATNGDDPRVGLIEQARKE